MLLLPFAGRLLSKQFQLAEKFESPPIFQWSEAHEDVSCEQFAKWLELNNADTQELQLAVFLEENGVRCPNCKSRYALSRGGCMHFKCAQCSFQVRKCGIQSQFVTMTLLPIGNLEKFHYKQ